MPESKSIIIIEDRSVNFSRLEHFANQLKNKNDKVLGCLTSRDAKTGMYNGTKGKHVIADSLDELILYLKKIKGDKIILADVVLKRLIEVVNDYEKLELAEYYCELTKTTKARTTITFYSTSQQDKVLIEILKKLGADPNKIQPGEHSPEGSRKSNIRNQFAQILILKSFNLYFGKPLNYTPIKIMLGQLMENEISEKELKLYLKTINTFPRDPFKFLTSELVIKCIQETWYENIRL